MAKELEKATFGEYYELVTWTNTLLILNAVLGLALFEWAWYKTRRFRNPIQELDAQFPELRRNDAGNWRKWKHYPMALTLMIPRILFSVLMALLLWFMLSIFLIGHDRSRPITGCRRLLCQGTLRINVQLMSVISWFTYMGYRRLTLEDVNHYEEYLGPLEEQMRY